MLTHVRYTTALLLALTLIGAPPLAAAQVSDGVSPYLSKRYFASAGVFFPDRRLKFELDGSVPTVESTVDFSERFKLDGADESGSFEIGWRFGEKWLLRGQFFKVADSTTATLTEDVQWGDYTFNAGTFVGGGSDVTVTRVFVGRAYRRRDAYEIGIGGGLHMLEVDVFVRGNAFINGMDAGLRKESASVSGPLPNIGAWYVHSLSPRWAASARLDWLSASVGDYDGRIVNAAIGANFALTEHFGIGINYNFFELDVGVSDSNWNGRAITRFDGPFVFLSGYW